MTNKKIAILRGLIDRTDGELLKALKRRFELTQKVGELKAEYDLPVRDIKREEEKLSRVAGGWSLKNPSPDFVRKLFSMIMAESRKNHRRLKGRS